MLLIAYQPEKVFWGREFVSGYIRRTGLLFPKVKCTVSPWTVYAIFFIYFINESELGESNLTDYHSIQISGQLHQYIRGWMFLWSVRGRCHVGKMFSYRFIVFGFRLVDYTWYVVYWQPIFGPETLTCALYFSFSRRQQEKQHFWIIVQISWLPRTVL